MAINGTESILSIWDGAAYRPVACITSNSFDSELSNIESNTKCDPGVVKKTPGTLNVSISADGEMIDTTSVGGDTAKASWDYLYGRQVQQKNDKLPIIFKYTTGTVDLTYYGDAIISSLNHTAPAGDEVITFSITLEVSGATTETDPNATT